MLNAKANFLFFCMIVVAMGAAAQFQGAKRLSLLQPQAAKKPVNTGYLFHAPIISVSSMVKPLPAIAGNFYSNNLGFFCKQEIKMDKAAKISLRFRLGSVADCDRLEGKGRG
jgi:hypothetical protein